jgi:pimeloyl-ACP methyl ester carboxylesterase
VRADAADLAALLDYLGLAPAHILGNSFGGSIVLHLAAERPDLFRSLLVHEPPLFGVLDDPASRRMLHIFQERVRVVIELLETGQMESGARQFMETIAVCPARLTNHVPHRGVGMPVAVGCHNGLRWLPSRNGQGCPSWPGARPLRSGPEGGSGWWHERPCDLRRTSTRRAVPWKAADAA